MKTEDLSKVKYIGASRMKSLHASGIITIKQLCETPIEKLAEISTIGRFYAKLIKAEANKVSREKTGGPVPRIDSGKEKAIDETKQDFKKKIKILKKRLNLAQEDLKNLKKKRHQKLYVDFKKRSETLMSRLNELTKTQNELSGKIIKKFFEQIDTLNTMSKTAGKNLKKKKLKKIFRKMNSFSKMLKKN